MATHDQDKAFTDAMKSAGLELTEERRAIFDAGYTARGDHDTKAIRQLKKGGWILSDRDTGFNFGIAAATRHISFVGGTPRRVIR
jgi:hypothetical protein